jgi:hypothetical protein
VPRGWARGMRMGPRASELLWCARSAGITGPTEPHGAPLMPSMMALECWSGSG